MFRSLKRTSKVFIVSVLTIVMVTPVVFADTASDPFETPSIKGHKYSFTSEVWSRRNNNGPTAEAVANFKVINGYVPAGYMGGQARLYNIYGTLVASSTWNYNPDDSVNMWVYSPRTPTYGYYYAQNKAQFYDVDGYVEYTGYKSPIYTLSSTSNAVPTAITKLSDTIENLTVQKEYSVNSNGETYGSALSEKTIGVEPDLISAIGTNGVQGYIKSEDLSPEVSSIKEAIALSGKNGDIQNIPLYDLNGTSVIGEFKLITNYEVVEK